MMSNGTFICGRTRRIMRNVCQRKTSKIMSVGDDDEYRTFSVLPRDGLMTGIIEATFKS